MHISEALLIAVEKQLIVSAFMLLMFCVFDEIRRLLYAADNLPVRNNAPTRHLVIPAVIRLLYCCGFRIGEVLRLRVKDVDLDTGIITVHNGKGGKDRLVPVHNARRYIPHFVEIPDISILLAQAGL